MPRRQLLPGEITLVPFAPRKKMYIRTAEFVFNFANATRTQRMVLDLLIGNLPCDFGVDSGGGAVSW